MSEALNFAEVAPHLANPLVLVGFVLLLVFGVHRTLIRAGLLQPPSRTDSGAIVRTLLRYGFVIAIVVIVAGFGLAAWRASLETPKPEAGDGDHAVDHGALQTPR